MATALAAATGREDSVVTEQCVRDLLEFFATRSSGYRARHVDRRFEIIEKMCLHLFARDYQVQTIDNSSGKLCGHYPASIIILIAHNSATNSVEDCDQVKRRKRKKKVDVGKLGKLFSSARIARCRTRFVVPALLFEDKYVCRSATLSTMAELYGRTGMDWIFSVDRTPPSSTPSQKQQQQQLTSSLTSSTDSTYSTRSTHSGDHQPADNNPSEWVLLSQARESDVQLLRMLSVRMICDLMVEMRKTKLGMPVSSSEKADGGQWYSQFLLASMPYPGCEFFKDYNERGRRAEGMMFPWDSPINDAHLSVPSPLPESSGIHFDSYQSWDLVRLTQNYLKLILHFLKHEDGGVLIHCISGWDRTPLFISLLRLSLWADGQAHQSLTATEVLYLTLAYDWMMFGHQFDSRIKKGEEIMYFCFDFLKHITSEEFSLGSPCSSFSSPSCSTSLSSSSSPVFDESKRQTPTGSVLANHEILATTDSPSKESVTSLDLSLRKVSLSSYEDKCFYHPSFVTSSPPRPPQPSSSLKHSSSSSSRSSRLMAVRDMFCRVYKTSVPYYPPSSAAPGLFSDLLARFVGRSTNV